MATKPVNLSPKMQLYHDKCVELVNLQTDMERISEQIISEECKYRQGDRVWYKTYSKEELKQGIVKSVAFDGAGSEKIDGLWIVAIQPVWDNWQPNHNRFWEWAGKERGSKCILDREYDGEE